MARSKNSLTDVSPASGQLKSSFSNSERAQLNALGQTSGAFSIGAGNINGSVSNSLQNFSYRDRSKLEIGGLYAEGLEKSGLTARNSGSIISSIISPSIDNRKPFYRNTPTRETDLSITSNRVPDPFRKSPGEKIADKQGSTLAATQGITFPPDLDQNTHAYIKLVFYEYQRPVPFEDGTIDPVGYISLPLTENFTQEFGVKYSPVDTGVVGAALGTDPAQDIMQKINMAAMGENVDIGLGTARDFIKAGGEVASYSGFRALSGVNQAIGGLVGQQLGAIPNPHPSVFLEGVDLRSYEFSWKLIPRSESEAEIIRSILKDIKFRCLPKKNGNYLTYPQMVEPKIVTAKGLDIGDDYKKSLLAGMSINYTAEGTSAFFYDGHPVAIQLTLQLQEAELYLDPDESGRQLGSFTSAEEEPAPEDGDGGE